MIGAFEFVDGGRTYRCRVEVPPGTRSEPWWWFEVSGDQQVYAPFRAASNDTRTSVKTRVVGFYMHRLARLAEPPAARHQRGRPAGSTTAAAAPSEAPVSA
jgi:hypothetical protein